MYELVANPTDDLWSLLLLVVVVIGGVGGKSISWLHREARGGILRAAGRRSLRFDAPRESIRFDDTLEGVETG
jgi:hypothetical protein